MWYGVGKTISVGGGALDMWKLVEEGRVRPYYSYTFLSRVRNSDAQ